MPVEELPSCILGPDSWTRELPLSEIFGNDSPVHVDAGCGKGRFLLSRARSAPDMNFLGIDRLLGRLRKVDRKVARAKLANIRLLRVELSYALEHLLPSESIAHIYIFFPDPWPKRRHHRRRLFNPSFLDSLVKCLAPHGSIHVATDHMDYFEQVNILMQSDNRLISIPPFRPAEGEKTDFELAFQAENRPIGRCSFTRR